MSDITPADALRELGDDQAEYAAAAAKKHAPLRVVSNMGIPFIDCSCGIDHYVQTSTWLETHWKGTQAEGLAAIQDVIDRQHARAEESP